MKKRYINAKAFNERRVYDKELMDESNGIKEEYITAAISEYFKRGIIINYKNCTSLSWSQSQISNLHTSLGDFKADYYINNNLRLFFIEEKTKKLVEALILNVLARFSFREALLIGVETGLKQESSRKEKTESLLPVKLKDKEEKDISIFSEKIEDYLAEGAIFRFLSCLIGIFLKESGIETSKAELESVSRETLFRIIAKKLPREDEDKIIRQLTVIVSEIMGSKFPGRVQHKEEIRLPAIISREK